MATEKRIYCNSTDKPYLLRIDEACLEIVNNIPKEEIAVYAQSNECEKCNPWYFLKVNSSESRNLVVNTSFSTTLTFVSSHNSTHSVSYHFAEYGQYQINTKDEEQFSVEILSNPANAFLPILYASIALLLLGLIWFILRKVYRHSYVQSVLLVFAPADAFHRDLGNPSAGDGTQQLIPQEDNAGYTSKRLQCIDTFRGICIGIMIFVNYGGGHYWFFKHSPWNGLTVADLVFPWFMWLMGVSLVISIRSRLRRMVSRPRIIWQILKRSVVLFALGIMLNSVGGKNDINYLRIPGVLQRFGLAYLLVAVIEACCLQAEDNYRFVLWSPIRDLATSWLQWLIIGCVTAIHTLTTFLLKVPGCGKGYLGPGGLEDSGAYVNCTGGAAGYIDRVVFGDDHIYQRPSCKPIYETTVPYDPEGLLGTLTAALTVFLGVQAGKILVTYPEMAPRIYRWGAWSFILGLFGGALCEFSQNNGVIPVNKNLWSLSYVFALSSMAYFLLIVLYYVIDVRKWWRGGPFMYAGMNAIVLYVGHEMTKNIFPFSWKPTQQTHLAKLFIDLWGTALWITIAYILYVKRLFFSL